MVLRNVLIPLCLVAGLLYAPAPASAGGGFGPLRPVDRGEPLRADRRDRIRLQPLLPDLYVRKCHYRVHGTGGFELQLTVKNVGAGASAAFESRVAVEVLGRVGVRNVNVQFPRIAANDRARVTVGFFPLPNREQDWDVQVTAKADWQGRVAESDEANNIRRCDVERIFAL